VRLAWCLIAGWVTAIFTQMTVYSGAQSIQYLFMLGAVGQVLVLTSDQERLPVKEPAVELEFIGRGFGFSRVI